MASRTTLVVAALAATAVGVALVVWRNRQGSDGDPLAPIVLKAKKPAVVRLGTGEVLDLPRDPARDCANIGHSEKNGVWGTTDALGRWGRYPSEDRLRAMVREYERHTGTRYGALHGVQDGSGRPVPQTLARFAADIRRKVCIAAQTTREGRPPT